jgi:hypothetical protein
MRVLRRIETKLDNLTQQENLVMAEIDDLQTAVTNEKTVEDSVVTLLSTFSAQLNAAAQSANDLQTLKQQIVTITGQVTNNSQTLADAVTANTPAAPPAP